MWFFLAISAGFLFAVNRLIIRTIARKSGNTLGLVVIHDLIAGALLLPFALINATIPSTLAVWLLVGVISVLILMADWFATKSLADIEASLYQIIGQLRHIIVLIGAVILFSEALSFAKVVAIFVLIAGVAVALFDAEKIKISKGVVDGFWSTAFIAVASLLIKEASTDISAALLASIALFVAGLIGTVLLNFKVALLKDVYKKTKTRLLTAAAIFALFEFMFFKALEIGEASRVTPATQSSLVFTIAGGYLFLNERSSMARKIIGSVLIAVAIAMIYFVAT